MPTPIVLPEEKHTTSGSHRIIYRLMRGSLKIFTWFKIPVYIHWSFSLIILYFVWLGFQEQGGPSGVLEALILLFSLFACVLLHEFGHSLMARRFNIDTQDIILTPIGGIARLERMPENPRQELLVAIAGPMVNVIIAAIIFLVGITVLQYHNTGSWYFENALSFWSSLGAGDYEMGEMLDNVAPTLPIVIKLLPELLILNVMMVVFNMIPAFPMDGGRVLRALIAMRVSRLKATLVAARIGQVISILFVITGIYFNAFTMALIGFFVFTTARTEYNMVRLEDVLKNYTAIHVLRRQFTPLLINDWIKTPLDLLLSGQEHNFLVFNMDQQLAGYLSEKSIIEAGRKKDTSTEVQQYMAEPPVTVSENESLRYIYFLIQQRKIAIVGVTNPEGVITGVVDKNGLENFMKVKG